MNDMNTTDRALSWDDEFTNEQQEFVLLPEGDYAFEVTGMERARFEGSAKLPPCSMAKLTLKIFGVDAFTGLLLVGSQFLPHQNAPCVQPCAGAALGWGGGRKRMTSLLWPVLPALGPLCLVYSRMPRRHQPRAPTTSFQRGRKVSPRLH